MCISFLPDLKQKNVLPHGYPYFLKKLLSHSSDDSSADSLQNSVSVFYGNVIVENKFGEV